jgi:hypothetical protein
VLFNNRAAIGGGGQEKFFSVHTGAELKKIQGQLIIFRLLLT